MTAFERLTVEFPDYKIASLPPIPAGWRDISWHNDACPSFEVGNVTIMIDYEQPEERETPELDRFSGFTTNGEGYTENFVSTNAWPQLLAAVAAKLGAGG